MRYINSKRKLLLNGTGEMMTKGMENADNVHALFASIFIHETGLQESQIIETREGVWSKEELPSAEEGKVREHLNKMSVQLIWPDGVHH